MPRALFVSYTFPPVGGAGVQRLTKWLKYLPRFDWQASVLTTENASVPLRDGSLGRDVPDETRVARARTLEPSYEAKASVLNGPEGPLRTLRRSLTSLARSGAGLVLQPDPQILWAPGALRAGRRLLSEVSHDIVVATAPPFSALLIGARLAREASLPLVLDFRDEWDISGSYWENRPHDPFSHWIQSRMQAHALRRAQLIIATTKRSMERLVDKARTCGSKTRAICIYNGYDAEDFAERQDDGPTQGNYRLVYVGTLWALTDASPLVDAVLRLVAENPDQARKLELVVAGRRTVEQSLVLGRLSGLPCRVDLFDYVDHGEAIRMMRGASGLCLLLSRVPAAERVIPAKLFEYMAARRPIIGIVPEGECRDILRGYPASVVCDPRDTGSTAGALSAEIKRAAGGADVSWGGWEPSRYSRERLTAELVEALASVLAGRDEQS